MDDRGVDYDAAVEQQDLRGQGVVNDVRHLCGQSMLLEQMAELGDRALVGHRLLEQFPPGKAAHRPDLVARILHCRV